MESCGCNSASPIRCGIIQFLLKQVCVGGSGRANAWLICTAGWWFALRRLVLFFNLLQLCSDNYGTSSISQRWTLDSEEAWIVTISLCGKELFVFQKQFVICGECSKNI